MNRVDFLETIWSSAWFNDNADMQEIADLVEAGRLDEIFDEELGFIEIETQFETSQQMEPKDNNGFSTIEVFNDNNDLIYKNGN